jgi:hypothetical protein
MAISISYLLDQLERALSTGRSHDDPATRERAARRAKALRSAIDGVARSTLEVGSRAPVAGVPAWVTLEVARGGFATGELAASGPLTEHEQLLLARLGGAPEGAERAACNVHYLGDEGRGELLQMLSDGRYRVGVPEEGALLTVAWLLARGEVEQACSLVEQIAPFFDRLRFFPVPALAARAPSATVKLCSVGEVVAGLATKAPQPRVARMNEALRLWTPLYDRAVLLFVETLDGPVPTMRTDERGKPLDGGRQIDGGTPGAHLPEGWRERARALLDEYAALRRQHSLCGKPEDPRENFFRLRALMARCLEGPLSAGERALLRKLVASYATRHGAPGSERLNRVREAQARDAARPSHHELRRVVVSRLRRWPADGGLASLGQVTAPLTEGEAREIGVTPGFALPASTTASLERCLEAPVETLVALGVISSGEVLAEVLPQITAQVTAEGIADPALGRLHGAVYESFRDRRSLLLLNLERQVSLGELPWVSATAPFRGGALGAPERSRQALVRVAALAISSFPQTILPNPLLQELRALAQGAGLDIPLVEELAADIFMGQFSPKFLEAARLAAGLLEGTLYERYYDLDFAGVRGLTSPAGLAALCERLAGVDRGSWSVARNGAILEQQQIITTHNLAALFQKLDLASALRGGLPELAQRGFTWACRLLLVQTDDHRARLQHIKNAAYALRQSVFFVSLCDRGEVASFVEWAGQHVDKQGEAFAKTFAPALRGLRLAAGGKRLTAEAQRAGEARKLLGWAVGGRHWLMA